MRRAVKILDILTWTEAFTIFQMVMGATHTHRWPDLTKYKLLIILLLANHPVELGWNTISPFGRLQQQLVPLTGPRCIWTCIIFGCSQQRPSLIQSSYSSITVPASRGYLPQPPHTLTYLEQWAVLAFWGMPLPRVMRTTPGLAASFVPSPGLFAHAVLPQAGKDC